MRSFLRLCLALVLPVVAAHAALPRSHFSAQELAQGYVEGRVIAKPRADRVASADIGEASSGMKVQGRFPRLGNLRILQVHSGESVKAAVARLRATGLYEYVEPDQIRYARVVPNDPKFSSQWSLYNAAAPDHDIDATAAWDTVHDATNVVVGVLDSGIRLTHQDLAGNLWSKPPGTSHAGTHGINVIDGNGAVSSYNPNDSDTGHGTHVSGIIGAIGNNGIGIAGVAWKVQLMGLRFLHGGDGTGSVSDAVTCINYAIENGAQIINGSYGAPTYSDAEKDAILAARNAGIIFVAAAGNDTLDTDHGNDYPAAYPLDNIVTVAATNQNDTFADYSNYGSGSVDLAAPGTDILSTYNGSDSDYETFSGTSMATPHVTGALALLRAKFPSETYRQIINRLLRGTDRLSALSGKVQTGGRLNVASALNSTTNRPFNDDFADRAMLSGEEIHVRSSNIGATTEAGEPSTAGSATLWWSWTATADTVVDVDTLGSSYDTALAVYTGDSVDALTLVTSDDNQGGMTTSSTYFTVHAGTTYQIAVGGVNGATGFTALHVSVVPVNDNFANATTLTGNRIQIAGTTLGASGEPGEPAALDGAADVTVWYKWQAPATGHVSLAVFATEIDTVAAVYSGIAVNPALLQRVASNDNNAGSDNTDALVSFTATKGKTYYFQIDHMGVGGTSGGDFILTLTDSLWEYPTFDEVSGSPAVSGGGIIYFGSVDGTVYSLSSTGRLRWSYATGDSIDGASPALSANNTVYIGSNDGYLYALNGATGTLLWKFQAASAISSTPAIGADGTIYFRDDTHLYALADQRTRATQKWKYTFSADATGTYASPTIGSDGTIYVGSTGGTLYAITSAGREKWRYATTGDIYTSVAIGADHRLYFATLSGRIYALRDAGTKASLSWVRIVGGSQSVTSSLAIAKDGTLYFGGYDKRLHAISANGTAKWTCALGGEVRASSPAIDSSGIIYLGSYDGRLYAINPAGKLVRSYPAALKIRSSPVIHRNRLYFGSSDAKLHAFGIGRGAQDSPWPMFQANRAHTGHN
jgi:outer membrane protein assembly factor BamB